MDHVAVARDSRVGSQSLWVIFALKGHSHCFELDGVTRYSVTVGSYPEADLRLYAAQNVPIACNLKRDGDDIWLIPGWPTNQIRVDSVVVDRPVRLWRRCALEIEGIALEMRVREEPPTSPDIELPNHRPAVHRESVGCSWERDRISVRDIVAIEPPGKSESPTSPKDTGWASTEGRVASSPSEMEGHLTLPSRRSSEIFEGPPSSAAPTVVSVGQTPGSSFRPLEQLGIMAKRRPWTVAVGAMLGAAAISVTLHLGFQALTTLRERAMNAYQAQPASLLPNLKPFCAEFDTPSPSSEWRLGRTRTSCKRLNDALRSVQAQAASVTAILDSTSLVDRGERLSVVPIVPVESQR